jgi:drug/metabolite transporter (DMT)-like permease
MPGFGFILISVAFNVTGQLVWRNTMRRFGEVSFSLPVLWPTLREIFTKPMVILGILCYVISLVFWLGALSRVELSKAYPMLSLGYVAVFVLSGVFLGESMGLLKLLGTLLVVGGLFLVMRG